MTKSFSGLIKEFAVGISLRLGIALTIMLFVWGAYRLFEEEFLGFLLILAYVVFGTIVTLSR